MKKIDVTINYNEKILTDFIKFNYRKMFMIYYIAGAILVSLGLASIMLEALLSGITVAVFGVLLLFFPMIIVAIDKSRNRRIINTVEIFTFSSESVKVLTSLIGEEIANQEIKYNALEKIVENNNYIYIYTTKVTAHIVDKNQISNAEYNAIMDNIASTMVEKG